MKKHDEGYVLAFVLVVMVVLCLVALSIMSISLRNLQNQQASIQRMEDKYAAQGAIEKVVAQLENATASIALDTLCQEAGVTCVKLDEATDKLSLSIQLTRIADTVKITCVVKLTSDSEISTTQEGDTTVYNLTNAKLSYTSYEISTVETEGGGTE